MNACTQTLVNIFLIIQTGQNKTKGSVGVLTRQIYLVGTQVVDCAMEDHQTWNLKVKARTWDTDLYRFKPCAWELFPGGVQDVHLGTRPSFI
jgi:hypothetical protein